HALRGEIEHLLRREMRGDETTRVDVVVESLEAVREPLRHRGARALREALRLLEILHRKNPRHDRDIDARRAHAVEKAKIGLVLEEELRDRARSARVDLALQRIEVAVEMRTLRMLLGKRGD